MLGNVFSGCWKVEGVHYKGFSFLQLAGLRVQLIWKIKRFDSPSAASTPNFLSLCPAEGSSVISLPGECLRNPEKINST